MTLCLNNKRFAKKLLLLAFVFVIAINLSVVFFHDPVTGRASASAVISAQPGESLPGGVSIFDVGVRHSRAGGNPDRGTGFPPARE